MLVKKEDEWVSDGAWTYRKVFNNYVRAFKESDGNDCIPPQIFANLKTDVRHCRFVVTMETDDPKDANSVIWEEEFIIRTPMKLSRNKRLVQHLSAIVCIEIFYTTEGVTIDTLRICRPVPMVMKLSKQRK